MDRSLLGLEGKVAVVTGASQGVGRGCALQLARAGAHVVVAARGLQRALAVAAEVRSLGREALAVEADVTREDDLQGLVTATREHFGGVDIGVNNVGGRRGEPQGRLLDSGRAYWRETLELNLLTALAGSQAFARAMVEGGRRGVIINIGSTTGYRASAGLAPYGAAKAGLVQLTKTLALELAPQGIRVAGVAPGMVDTEALRAYLDEAAVAERARQLPAGRLATPDDLGKVVVMMASDLAGWVYGSTLVADGGELLLSGA